MSSAIWLLEVDITVAAEWRRWKAITELSSYSLWRLIFRRTSPTYSLFFQTFIDVSASIKLYFYWRRETYRQFNISLFYTLRYVNLSYMSGVWDLPPSIHYPIILRSYAAVRTYVSCSNGGSNVALNCISIKCVGLRKLRFRDQSLSMLCAYHNI